MTARGAEIAHVSDTAFWVAHYRATESERRDALFRDPFARVLVGKRGPQMASALADISKYVQWSVVSRTVIIDRFIERLVHDGVDAIINLGAGLDARPYRLALPPSLAWIEVDYPDVIDFKTEALGAERPACRLERVAVDLADDSKRRAFLQDVLPQSRRVLVLTEGVLPYLEPAQVAALGRDLFAVPRIAHWITEYFHPRVYRYLQHPVRTKALKNAPFRFFPPDWFGFFAELGWVEHETRFSGEIAQEFGRKIPMPRLATLLFPFLPKAVKAESARMTGFSLLTRAGA